MASWSFVVGGQSSPSIWNSKLVLLHTLAGFDDPE
jgi:hypothetical protein